MSSYVNQKAISDDDDDDDDDDDNDDEWWLLLQNGWRTIDFYVLFPGRAIVRDSYHCKSQTCHKSGMNLHRIWVQTSLNEVVQQWQALRHSATK